MKMMLPRLELAGLSFGERVRAQRTFLSMTQEELAVKLGVDRGTVSSYELNRTKPRTQRARERLAEVLDLEYEDLYDAYDGVSVPKAIDGISIGVDFGQLRRSMAKNNGLQLRAWKKFMKYVLEYARPSVTDKDRQGIESCLREISKIQKGRRKQKEFDKERKRLSSTK